MRYKIGTNFKRGENIKQTMVDYSDAEENDLCLALVDDFVEKVLRGCNFHFFVVHCKNGEYGYNYRKARERIHTYLLNYNASSKPRSCNAMPPGPQWRIASEECSQYLGQLKNPGVCFFCRQFNMEGCLSLGRMVAPAKALGKADKSIQQSFRRSLDHLGGNKQSSREH